MSFTLLPPVFARENYHIWVVKMKTYLQAHDLWNMVENDAEPLPLRANPTIAQMRQHSEECAEKNKAIACLQNRVSDVIFNRTMACDSPKLLSDDFKESKVVEKVIILEKFESKISSLKDSRALSTISLFELVNFLYAFEQRRANSWDSMERWPKGTHDELGIFVSILLVMFVTATSDYRQSLQFKDLDKERKKITIQVTKNACRQKMSIYDLFPSDIVHLNIGDQVPINGLFVSGFSVLIHESSLTGESEPVIVNADNPFMLYSTKLQDGSCKIMVISVGMRKQ
ncbi:hypothetical protein J1N35_044430 [Gossypium stocksii]|uniref:DUF4219 domain-containing protein n=1 Tax=Gossypium stocksii TaxID=47602 RepID=A0A9D3ZFY9_9ROSI|nr:hypothetical protein J1N35_044430 [Gossypium stocksii]